MDYGQLYKDIIAFNGSSFKLRLLKLRAVLLRTGLNFYYSLSGKKLNVKDIPIIINNRNRYTYLLELIVWLEKSGMTNIYIIDNASTYPPLLEYYKKTPYQVFRFDENIGHLALWKTDVYEKFKKNYYIYTDPDVLPVEECPSDAVEYFLENLMKYSNIEKIGFGLKIDDLPDCYFNKGKVIEWEKRFWLNKIEENIYDASIDTTFALYRPYTDGSRWVANAYRTGGKYIARHLPWYEDSDNPKEEEIYYMEHVKSGASHWIPINSD